MGSTNELFNIKIVEVEGIWGQIKKFWQLQSLAIESETQDSSNVDEEIMTDIQSSIVFKGNRYKAKFPWKMNLKRILNDNREMVHRRFWKLRTSFRKDPL